MLFWLLVALRSRGDQTPEPLMVAAVPASSAMEQGFSDTGVVASATESLNIAGLLNDYLAVFGILVASVILAMRRRAHLVFGQQHRRR